MGNLDEQQIKQVKTINDWGWWYKINQIYTVKKYPYKATKDATVCAVNCGDGQDLYDMYEVVDGEYAGSIIPVVATVDA